MPAGNRDLLGTGETGHDGIDEHVRKHVGLGCPDHQHPGVHVLERRCLRHLSVRGDDGAAGIAVAQAPVRSRLQVLGQLVRQKVPPRQGRTDRKASLDRLLDVGKRVVDPVALGSFQGNRRGHPHGGIEERKPTGSLRVSRCELKSEAATEAVADDVDAREAERVQRVEYIADVSVEVPGRFPLGVTVTAEVDGDHAIGGQVLLGQTAEASAVTRDAVKAEDRGSVRVTPLVHVQSHLCQRTDALSLAILYDLHGNLAALEAVLEAAQAEGIDRHLLGGDYAAFGPWPRETLERLCQLENATWIRGNGERWLIETDDVPPLGSTDEESPIDAAIRELAPSEIDRLYALPTQVTLDGVLYVHGSPRSDVESFAPEPQDGEEQLLEDVFDRTVVFGHSHLQFRRPGPNGTDLLNPGSVGMPLDGDTSAAWAVRRKDGSFNFRRTGYDVERAVAKARELGGTWGEMVARRLTRGSD